MTGIKIIEFQRNPRRGEPCVRRIAVFAYLFLINIGHSLGEVA
jgi:hypothetical protein